MVRCAGVACAVRLLAVDVAQLVEHPSLEEDVPREVRGQAEVELPVVQREGAADREEVRAAQRVPLQLG